MSVVQGTLNCLFLFFFKITIATDVVSGCLHMQVNNVMGPEMW